MQQVTSVIRLLKHIGPALEHLYDSANAGSRGGKRVTGDEWEEFIALFLGGAVGFAAEQDIGVGESDDAPRVPAPLPNRRDIARSLRGR